MADKKGGRSGKAKGGRKGGRKSARKSGAKAVAKRPAAKSAAKTGTPTPPPTRIAYVPREARAVQRTARQSPYKMRLVIDQVRGQSVNDALALLAFSKKHAAKQIEKVIRSAVANAENAARSTNATLDVDELFIKYAVINEGPKLKRWTPAAMGRATPVLKRTSHVEIVVAERPEGGAR
jgi:large subunit ribosomal protein L22